MRIVIPLFVVALMLLSGCRSSRSVTVDDKVYTERDGQSVIADVDRRAIVEEARRWLGTKYRYGGNDRSGVDCSGMVAQVYLKVANVKLPRNSAEQQKYCRSIGRNDLCEGDLVFFATGSNKKRVSHVGIYIGKDKMIHASSSQGVIVSDINERYYSRNYHSSGCVDAAFRTSSKSSTPSRVVEVSVDKLDKIMKNDTVASSLNQVLDQKVDSIYSTWLE